MIDTLVEHLRKAGQESGKVWTPRKLEAVRRNLEKARAAQKGTRMCRLCGRNRLARRNRSGVCRNCQRAPKRFYKVSS